METNVKGNLIIIGGAEDKKGEKKILKYVSSIVKKAKGLLVIATVATEKPEIVGEEYTKIFKELGVDNINVLNVINRDDCYLESNISLVKEAILVFFTGGDQLRITSLLGGTPIYDEMERACKEGCYFVGTSAGASVMSGTMIVGGESEESPRKCTLKMAPGLGFLDNVIIDQHFAQRGRIGRLLAGISQNPEILGIGIDEDTAITVDPNGILSVIGSGAVYITDGRDITYTNVSEQHQDEVLSMFDVRLHVLTPGKKYNLITKVPFEEERNNHEDN